MSRKPKLIEVDNYREQKIKERVDRYVTYLNELGRIFPKITTRHLGKIEGFNVYEDVYEGKVTLSYKAVKDINENSKIHICTWEKTTLIEGVYILSTRINNIPPLSSGFSTFYEKYFLRKIRNETPFFNLHMRDLEVFLHQISEEDLAVVTSITFYKDHSLSLKKYFKEVLDFYKKCVKQVYEEVLLKKE